MNTSDKISILALIVSAIVLGLVVIQTHALTEQFSIQNRPWLSIMPESKITLNGNLFEIPLKNYGKSPALNVIITSYVSDGKMTENDIVKNGVEYTKSDFSPEESFTHSAQIPQNVLSTIQNNGDAYIGLIANYNFEENKTAKTTLIIRWVTPEMKFLYETKELK